MDSDGRMAVSVAPCLPDRTRWTCHRPSPDDATRARSTCVGDALVQFGRSLLLIFLFVSSCIVACNLEGSLKANVPTPAFVVLLFGLLGIATVLKRQAKISLSSHASSTDEAEGSPRPIAFLMLRTFPSSPETSQPPDLPRAGTLRHRKKTAMQRGTAYHCRKQASSWLLLFHRSYPDASSSQVCGTST